MKAVRAKRATFKVSDSWESPPLHILFTREDNVIVARCLDFIDKFRAKMLPAEELQEVLDFMEFLYQKEKGFDYTRIENSAEYVRSL